MPDTLTLSPGITSEPRAVYHLKRSAVDQYKTRKGVTSDEEVWTALGLSRATFYRLLRGAHDICDCRARSIARRMGYPLNAAFERANRDA